MAYETLPQMLSRIDLFAGVPREVLNDLVQRGARLKTQPGRRVVEQGGTDAGLQVVLTGGAEVLVNDEPRGSIKPGDYFGEISLIDGAPRSATIVTGPDGMTTFALSSLAFAPIIAENPTVARCLLQALCARIRAVEGASADAP